TVAGASEIGNRARLPLAWAACARPLALSSRGCCGKAGESPGTPIADPVARATMKSRDSPDNGARAGAIGASGTWWSAKPSALESADGSTRTGEQGGAMSREADDAGALLSSAVERAVELAVLGGRQGRRAFIERVGAATAGAALAAVFPMRAAQALAQQKPGPL